MNALICQAWGIGGGFGGCLSTSHKKTAVKETLPAVFLNGAGDEIRTHDPNLGKIMLYP